MKTYLHSGNAGDIIYILITFLKIIYYKVF